MFGDIDASTQYYSNTEFWYNQGMSKFDFLEKDIRNRFVQTMIMFVIKQGLAATLVAAFASSIATVLNEAMLKSSDQSMSFHLQNAALYGYGMLFDYAGISLNLSGAGWPILGMLN